MRKGPAARRGVLARGTPAANPSGAPRAGGAVRPGLMGLLRPGIVACAAVMPTGCAPDPPTGESLRIFAASSLTEAFQEMADAFEDASPGTDAVLVFAGSQVLRLQIEQGARADIFASADPRHMESLAQEGLVTGPRLLAENELVVIVPPGNPAGIEAFADLAGADRVVIGTPNVPVGAYAREVLRRAEAVGALPGFEEAVMRRVVSEESNVRQVRAKVELGEADAALVYRTDAVPGRVTTVQVPPRANVRARYLIGVVAGTRNPAAAERWVAFASSPEGRRILSRHGFHTVVRAAQ